MLSQRVSILWTTSSPGTGMVTVAGPSGFLATASAAMQIFRPSDTDLPSVYYQYQADVTGLQPGTDYTYRVSMDGQAIASDPALFNFSTPSPGKYSFLSFGDSGSGSAEQKTLIQRMKAEAGISKVIHVGDMAYSAGTFAQFEANYFGLNAALMSRVPFYATPGNHEYETKNAAAFVAGHAAPLCGVCDQDLGRYYSFDWGDVHFASFDSNLLPTAAATRMLTWLDNDLAASGKYWKIVFAHHPPYPTGTHLNDPICALVRQNVNPIVERNGVQLVLNGHEHGYERSWPLAGGQRAQQGASTTYIVTGGGGGIMEVIGSVPECAYSIQAFHYLRVDVDNSQLSLSALGLSGDVIDRVTLAPPPVLRANSVVSIGDYTPAIASGSLASIFGSNLAIRPVATTGFPLPAQLGGVTVTANGKAVPLLYVSPSQINVQIPYEVSGQVTLQVTTANGSVSTMFQVAPVAPSILAVTAQDALCSAANPARPGGYVTAYVTGLGAAVSPVATGDAAPLLANPMLASIQVFVGQTALQPSYAGLAPGLAGLSQINFAIPSNLPAGIYPLRIGAGPARSQAANLTVGFVGGAAAGDVPTRDVSGGNGSLHPHWSGAAAFAAHP
ncbi:MAG: metallophosphoesterase [Acidobacteriota bacterium]